MSHQFDTCCVSRNENDGRYEKPAQCTREEVGKLRSDCNIIIMLSTYNRHGHWRRDVVSVRFQDDTISASQQEVQGGLSCLPRGGLLSDLSALIFGTGDREARRTTWVMGKAS